LDPIDEGRRLFKVSDEALVEAAIKRLYDHPFWKEHLPDNEWFTLFFVYLYDIVESRQLIVPSTLLNKLENSRVVVTSISWNGQQNITKPKKQTSFQVKHISYVLIHTDTFGILHGIKLSEQYMLVMFGEGGSRGIIPVFHNVCFTSLAALKKLTVTERVQEFGIGECKRQLTQVPRYSMGNVWSDMTLVYEMLKKVKV
jgi:hypothetical protein